MSVQVQAQFTPVKPKRGRPPKQLTPTPQPQDIPSPTPSPVAADFNTRPLFTEDTKHDLDEKYTNPELMGGFKCYFGKWRDKGTFADVAKDTSYTKFIMGCQARSSCMYLFQRYVRATQPEYSE